eukprot:TRINITY_DN1090_c0_g1::TRINITY_DN1090_c0_g1_i1::g.29901::m.29901 TRINITY_DN1090_c0_g1::TRINITY_DN1090_c0_g1_i1::g.29901  ORF type:complete len:966 (+),score=226.36,sp/Q8R5L3/VPS39_MOUSE/24.27/6e-65,Vps39_2/PF10367.4/5.9e+03,Vps39_2/PF10367.4/3.3e-28,CNH/PF00780.17/3.5e-22,CNH/PF00780.17/1.9e+03,Vps39_1/PF10366.4/3.1e-06,Vps39_1/PF10366.4/9.5e+03,Clathrin/PF00637.15/7e+03,Clathrin/PF00637.15/2.5e-05,TPR_2/PF07719.12/6.1,TPR_2/PF07719.12/4.7,TPR_2/PF07719.12/8.7e+02,TPR_8/PF13181.1/2.9e+02,TPR_8/PF
MTAFDIIPILERFSSDNSVKLECLAFSGDLFYVGTTDGNILAYHIKSSLIDKQTQYATFMETRRNLGYGKKPVEQIAIAKDAGKMIVLCDGNLLLLDLISLELSATLTEAKGANMFACKVGDGNFKVAIGLKKKILLYEISKGGFTALREFSIPEPVGAIHWIGKFVIAGFKRGFNMIHETTGEVDELFPLDKTVPMLAACSRQEVVLSSGSMGVIVGADGQMTRSSVNWSAKDKHSQKIPYALAGSFPYIIASFPKVVEVYSMLTQSLIQSIPFDKDRGGAVKAWAADESNVNDKRILLATPLKVFCLQPLPFKQQMVELLKALKVKEAAELLNVTFEDRNTETYKETSAEFNELAGFSLFESLQFEEAIPYFKKSNVLPREICAYFPSLCIRGLKYEPKKREVGFGGCLWPNDIQMVKAALLQRAATDPTLANAKMEDNVDHFLWDGKKAAVSILLNCRKVFNEGSRRLDGLDRALADTVLIKLLVDLIAKESKGALSEKEKFILMRSASASFMARRPSQTNKKSSEESSTPAVPSPTSEYEEILRTILSDEHNDAVLEECESHITSAKLYTSLGLLYSGKGYKRKALEVWEKLGAQDPPELVEFGKDGVAETVQCLQETSDFDLIVRFAPWILKRSADLGMDIFIKHKRPADLPILRLLDFLTQQGIELYIRYIEYLISEETASTSSRDSRRSYHTDLVFAYLKTVQSSKENVERAEQSQSSESRVMAKQDLLKKRNRLLNFLKASSMYDVKAILDHVERQMKYLHDESVILYARAGQFDNALRTMVFRKADCPAAERFCEEYPLLTQGGEEEVITLCMKLLDIYLHPGSDDVSIYWRRAIDFMMRHCHRLNPSEVVSLLPDGMPLQDVEAYLTISMRHHVHSRRSNQIMKELCKMGNLNAQCSLVEYRSKPILITPSKKCAICQRLIGDKVFAAQPDGDVVHLSCHDKTMKTNKESNDRFQ